MKSIQVIKILSVLLLGITGFSGEFAAEAAPEIRLKDLVEFQGARGNQLFGYGLVVGLNGTGDKSQTVFTSQSLTNMLDKLGIAPTKLSKFGLQSSGNEVKVKNVAAVLVTAELTPFMRSGNRIDITVSSIGDAKSLEGGTLVMTPLQGADGKIYAVAQGQLSIGGLVSTEPSVSYPTVAHVPSGAFVEQEVPVTFMKEGRVIMALREPDFTTASRIEDAVNRLFPESARAIDGGSVEVLMNSDQRLNPINFIGSLEQILVKDDIPAKVVINERTGTIVTGDSVRISSVAISHGALTVSITPKKDAKGNIEKDTEEADSNMLVMDEAVSIGQVAKGLTALGAKPSDMIAIFQAMKRSGALKARLEIM